MSSDVAVAGPQDVRLWVCVGRGVRVLVACVDVCVC